MKSTADKREPVGPAHLFLFFFFSQYSSGWKKHFGEVMRKIKIQPIPVILVNVKVCNLRVHSFSGMLELMWMLSIQMCPLVPCTKKPSITTWRSQKTGEEEEEEEEEEEVGVEKEEEEEEDRMKVTGEQRERGEWRRQIKNEDKRGAEGGGGEGG